MFTPTKILSQSSSQMLLPNNWTSQTGGFTTNQLFDAAYGNGTFIVVGTSAAATTSQVWRSTNEGVTWTESTANFANRWLSCTYGNGIFAVIGDSGYATSTDGITWTNRTFPLTTVAAASLPAVKYLNGEFLMGSDSTSGELEQSTAGVTYTNRRTVSNNFTNGFAYMSSIGRWIASNYFSSGGFAHTPLYSDDTTTWSTGTGVGAFISEYCAASPARGAACGRNAAITFKIWTTDDGTTYTERLSTSEFITKLYWNNNLWVAIGTEAFDGVGRVYTSFDGITWTSPYTVGVNPCKGMAFSPQTAVLCSATETGTDASQVFTQGI